MCDDVRAKFRSDQPTGDIVHTDTIYIHML